MKHLTIVTPKGILEIPLRELQFSFARSSGPGGQNVNKVNSKVLLRWNLHRNQSLPPDVRERILKAEATRISHAGDMLISCQRYRDQGRNVADGLERLREIVAASAIPPTARKKTAPSRGARQRRLQDKQIRSRVKKLRTNRPGHED